MRVYDPQNPPSDIIEELPPVHAPTDEASLGQDKVAISDVVEGIPAVRPPTTTVSIQLTEVE